MDLPKCKDCDYQMIVPAGYINTYMCCHPEVITVVEGRKYPKGVYAKEYRTSPKWCPKRERGGE